MNAGLCAIPCFLLTRRNRYCDEIRFYVANKTSESDVVQMSMDDEVEAHNNMWEKVWRMFEKVAG